MSTEPTSHPAREIAEKKARESAQRIVLEYSPRFGTTDNARAFLMACIEEELLSFLTRSEEEKNARTILNIDELTPQPFGVVVQALPGNKVLLYPTEIEQQICQLYARQYVEILSRLEASQDALATVSEDAGELQSQLSTLTALLKEAEKWAMRAEHHAWCAIDPGVPCNCGLADFRCSLTAPTPRRKESMKDEEINRAIAEHLGWKFEIRRSYRDTPAWFFGNVMHFDGHPDYCNDLNAMHEAEKVLTLEQRRGDEYAARIADVTGCDDMLFGFIHATARQRAEAFLKTIGKWQESTVEKE